MKEIKNLKYLFCSFVILAALMAVFVKAFISNELIYFLISAVLTVVFILFYSFVIKKITCEEGFTVVQAFFFYKRCKKAGIVDFSENLDDDKKKCLELILSDYACAQSFDVSELGRFYEVGNMVCEYFKGKKEK